MGLILLIVLILLWWGLYQPGPTVETGDMRPARAWVDCPDSNNPLVTARVLMSRLRLALAQILSASGPADQLAPPFHRYDIRSLTSFRESRLLLRDSRCLVLLDGHFSFFPFFGPTTILRLRCCLTSPPSKRAREKRAAS